MSDNVNNPEHYQKSPSGVECIAITEHMTFNLGNAVKYIWRAEHKNGLEDLEKAKWSIEREIQRLSKMRGSTLTTESDSPKPADQPPIQPAKKPTGEGWTPEARAAAAERMRLRTARKREVNAPSGEALPPRASTPPR